jgi:formate-nitrite transporter family protein
MKAEKQKDIKPSKQEYKPDAQDAAERTSAGAHVIYDAIVMEAEDELKRSSSALALSGLAAGLSMGFSLIAEAALQTHLPPAEWAPLITKLGYSVGFLLVILGRQQLFTENTLTPIIPLLDRQSHVRISHVARLWGIVLVANLVGAALFAFGIARVEFFQPETRQAFHEIGTLATHGSFARLFVGAVFAGWLVALMVWLQPGAKYTRLHVIIILSYLIGIAGFPHIIAGSVEVLYLVAEQRMSLGQYLIAYLIPVLLGNTVGGVMLVAALNYGQVSAGEEKG